MGSKLKLQEVKRRFGVELLTLFFMGVCLIFSSLFLLFIVIPSLLYRLIVKVLAKCCHPDLSQMMTGGTQLFALENITEKAKSNIVVCFVLEGQISKKMQEFRSLFTIRVLDKEHEDRGKSELESKLEPVYPELRQSWTSFMSYSFWKNETHFDIKEHIRIFDYEWNSSLKEKETDEFNINPNPNQNPNSKETDCETKIYNEKDLKRVATKLLSEPWKRDFSPWEILIIPKFQYSENNPVSGDEKQKSAVFIRFHHAMGDGRGWLNIILNDLCQSTDVDAGFPQISLLKKEERKWWQNLLLPIKMPYNLVKNTVECYYESNGAESKSLSRNPRNSKSSRNPWHTPAKRSKKYYTSITSPISVQRIKDLKNGFGVSYAAVLTSAISGAIRRVMIEAGQNPPNTINAGMAVPLPNHPGKICVHAALLNLSWPISPENSIPVVRLEQVWREMSSKRKDSLFPLVFVLTLRFGHIFPNFILRMLYNKALVEIAASLFPGPVKCPNFLGCTAIDSFFLLGLPPGQIGAMVTSLGVGGNQRIAVAIDNSLYPSHEKFEKLGGFIEQELEKLESKSKSASFESCDLNHEFSLENIV